MRYIVLAVLFLLSLTLQGTVFHFWSWSGIKPDLPMLLTMYIAMHNRPAFAGIVGLIFGLCVDLYLGRYLGMYTLTLTIVALISSWLAERWYRENFLLTVFLVFLVSVVGQFIVGFLGLAAGLPWSSGGILRLVFGISLYNALLVPLTYPWMHHSFLHGVLRYRPKYER